MRAITAAALQVQPLSTPLTRTSAAANVTHCVEWLRRCVEESGPDLVVLPETCTTGFAPGLSAAELWAVVDDLPGELTAPLDAVAAELGIHLVYGSYQRGPEPAVVFNAAVLTGPTGEVLGRYRKTHPFCTEIVSGGGWVTPGDEACVVETDLGAIGLIICFDGDYPELSRVCALLGAEILVRPSALLRSADIWELTNRARAYDNHVYVVASNATGVDPGGTIYFGNSMIVTPVAEVVARGSSYEQWVTARLDPETALTALTPGSSVGQGFDHLADRNLALLERYRDLLSGPGATRFPYPRSSPPRG